MSLKRLAVLTALAAALSLLERAIPSPLPWLKPGLANVITLYLAARGEYRAAVLVAILRSFVAALAFGGIFSPAHLFSLGGGLAAVCVTILLVRYGAGWFSIYGVSIAAATAHGAGQLVVGGLLFISWAAMQAILPLLVVVSIGTGIVTAWFAARILRREETE